MMPPFQKKILETEVFDHPCPDGIDLSRRVMEDMFIPLFLDEGARDRIGFTHISRLVGPLPGWYLWTKDRKGAFLLEQRETESHSSKIVRAHFLLRYYPSPDEPFFHDFAFSEREARLSSFFDRTGTPSFERRSELNESLFAVGNLHLTFDPDLRRAEFKISSQDRWIEVYEDGLVVQRDSGERIPVVAKGGIDRKVRGWQLSWDFYDKLLLGFCYVHKSPPGALRLTEFIGRVYCITGGGQILEREDPTIRGWILEAGLTLRPAGQKFSLDRRTKKRTLFESAFPPRKENQRRVEYFDSPVTKKHPWIDPRWWEAQSWCFPKCGEVDHRCFKEQEG